MIKRIFDRILGKIFRIIRNLRYFYYYNFNNGYVMKSLKQRKGECKHCGLCCWDCYELAYKDGKSYCEAYSNRPKWCKRDLPFDKLDLKLSRYKDCGYYWEK